MAAEHGVTDWIDLKVQSHWYKIRRELEHEIQAATEETRKAYGLSVKLNTATITTDGDRSVLRVPVSARWRDDLEQTIANVLVTTPREDEPRIAAIAHDIAALLERWVEREVPVGASPDFLYPEAEARWPAEAAPAAPEAAAQSAG